MNVKDLDLKKTGLLFFDILNGYVTQPEPGKPRVLKPWIQNAVKLSQAGRAAGLPVFLPRATIVPTARPAR
jgi:hypothetical protein